MAMDLRSFINRLPKTELHVHIEGTLEPELLLELAARNGYQLPFEDVDAVHAAYRFTDLQSFLDIYYQGAGVLQTPTDFYDLMTAYLRRAAADGVRHAEIFFDPQTHTHRDVGFPVFMPAFRSAIADATSETGITADLILCFLRHLSGDDAIATLRDAEPHLEGVIAVGLDSSERGRPPELFEEAFAMARDLGLRTVAHAGEEGPPEYITGALDVLGAERIDHGVRCLEDPELVSRLRTGGVALTVCPLSNVALKVVDRIEDHPLPRLIEAGITVTVNSDDPAYFGGYVGDNYQELADGLGLGPSQLVALARNSIEASFLDPVRKSELLAELEAVARN
ncbi:MAG TPA: adenosine deaminase [Acidimicrobiia bacterium]|nr:adenosine deaminase [Acidimicrobiia bacterium]